MARRRWMKVMAADMGTRSSALPITFATVEKKKGMDRNQTAGAGSHCNSLAIAHQPIVRTISPGQPPLLPHGWNATSESLNCGHNDHKPFPERGPSMDTPGTKLTQHLPNMLSQKPSKLPTKVLQGVRSSENWNCPLWT